MDAAKLTNGSRPEDSAENSVLPVKGAQRNAERAETKKVEKTGTRKRTKKERPTETSTRSSKSEKLVCRYCGSKDLPPSFVKRRDRRCRKCFSKRYGSSGRTEKTKVKK